MGCSVTDRFDDSGLAIEAAALKADFDFRIDAELVLASIF